MKKLPNFMIAVRLVPSFEALKSCNKSHEIGVVSVTEFLQKVSVFF